MAPRTIVVPAQLEGMDSVSQWRGEGSGQGQGQERQEQGQAMVRESARSEGASEGLAWSRHPLADSEGHSCSLVGTARARTDREGAAILLGRAQGQLATIL
jgi:hypothetical protein